MENKTPPIIPTSSSQGCASELAWLGAGFTLPFASQEFYRQVVRRSARLALLFYIVFIGLVSLLMILELEKDMDLVRTEIMAAYDDNVYPIITIKDGITNMAGGEPIVIADSPAFWAAVDTTGTYQQIDRDKYFQGILLTERELHVYNNGNYDRLPLTDLHDMLQENPIVIDRAWVAEFSSFFVSIMEVVISILIFGLNFFIRPGYIAITALLIRGIVSISRPELSFKPIFILGLYALVPAITIDYLIVSSGITITLLQSILHVSFWWFAGYSVYNPPPPDPEASPPTVKFNLAGLALPMMLAILINIIYIPTNGYLLLWAVFLPSLLTLIYFGSRE